MARINIEECWWSDPRRTALLLKIGFEADSAAVNMWRIAQEFWGRARGLIPKELFDKTPHSQALIECGLANVRESFVYVRGSSQYLDWHAEKREQAREAGKKSAEIRRKKSGSAQPEGGRQDKKIERESNENRTNVNEIEPSLSGSLSLSGSSKNKSLKAGSRKSAPPSPDVSRFIGTYVKAFQGIKDHGSGSRPDLSPKVLGEISRYLAGVPIDRACELIQVYCQMDEPWFKTKAYDFTTFASNQSKIGVALDTGKTPGHSDPLSFLRQDLVVAK